MKRKQISEKQREHQNKQRIETKYEPGQLVTLRNFDLAEISGGATLSKYTGPYIINTVNANQSTCTLTHLQNGGQKRSHTMHLRPYNPNNQDYPLPNKLQNIPLLNQDNTNIQNKPILPFQNRYNLRHRNH